MKPNETNETKTTLIRKYEKMYEFLLEASEHFLLQFQSEADQYLHGAGHDAPNLVAFEVAFSKQRHGGGQGARNRRKRRRTR